MQSSALAATQSRARAELAGSLPRIGAWGLGFALVAYLALAGGGFDVVVRSDVGIAVWWVALIGAAAGVLPTLWGRGAWTAVGLLAAFALWTGLAAMWTGSDERTVAELGRVATYVGILVLGLGTQRAVGGRALLNGVASAIGVVGGLAVLSRLHPSWFPHNDLAEFFPDNARRLSYPLNYWNGLACFAAMGLPLLGAAARHGRTVAGRALSAAALPVLALCIYFTVSRGGIIAALVGMAVLVVLVRERLPQLAALVPATLGSVILVAAAAQRDDLVAGLGAGDAAHQGDVMLAMVLVVVAGVALVHVTFDAVVRRRVVPWGERHAGQLRAGGLALLLVAVVVALAGGVPGRLSDDWQAFKSPDTPESTRAGEDVFARLGNPAGNGRYQYWMSAKAAGESEPLHGIGPGTFEFWWTQHPTFDGPYIHHAHSLWWETFGELGAVGLLLLGGMFLLLLGHGAAHALRAPPERRATLAAAMGGVAVFLAFASFDWGWTLGVLPGAALLLGAVVLARDGGERGDRPRGRIAVVALAALALPAIAIPLAAAADVRESQASSRAGDLRDALTLARRATAVQPYSATAHMQEALVLEQAGALVPALEQARRTTALEPDNWRNWVVRSRLEARTGRPRAAVASFRRARSLNPTSPIFKP